MTVLKVAVRIRPWQPHDGKRVAEPAVCATARSTYGVAAPSSDCSSSVADPIAPSSTTPGAGAPRPEADAGTESAKTASHTAPPFAVAI